MNTTTMTDEEMKSALVDLMRGMLSKKAEIMAKGYTANEASLITIAVVNEDLGLNRPKDAAKAREVLKLHAA